MFPDYGYETLLYISPLIAIPIFYFFGLYHAVIRYIGFKASQSIFLAVSAFIIVWAFCGFILGVDVPDSVLIYHENGNIYKVSKYFSGLLVLSLVNWFVSLLLIGGVLEL